MQLRVERGPDDGVAVLGQLFIDGVFECYTLEPSAARATYPEIPAGTYRVLLTWSHRFNEITPHILDVPGRSSIEIHPGNKAGDTEGCTLVGEVESRDWVGSSRVAFESLMKKLETADEIYITYASAGSGIGLA